MEPACGSYLSKPIGNRLLQNEIDSSNEERETIDTIDAVVDFNVIMQLLGIGILLTVISSMASMISIQRFSPLTILKERS